MNHGSSHNRKNYNNGRSRRRSRQLRRYKVKCIGITDSQSFSSIIQLLSSAGYQKGGSVNAGGM